MRPPTIVKLTVPDRYRTALRSGLIREVADASEALRKNDDRDALLGDLAWPTRLLQEDLTLLGELLDAEGDTTIEGSDEVLFQALEMTCRHVTDELEEEMKYGPLDMDRILELIARLQWAANESIRIDLHPELGDDESDQEGGA
jgi:hypothetical protein